MKSYLDLLGEVKDFGEAKENRTGVTALTMTPVFFQHNMENGFPLLTTKKMAWKTLCVELEGFIGGITDKAWYQERGCFIWDSWANPQTVEREMKQDLSILDWAEKDLDKERAEYHKICSDLGPIYGWQARRFNLKYEGPNSNKLPPLPNDRSDQLATVVERLKTNPDCRRHVISHWNPAQAHQMALEPCHYTYCFQHLNGKLSLHWTQRSCDSFLGVPFNIASYALLLELVAKETGLHPYMLCGSFVDFHLYENHVDQAVTQLGRQPRKLPQLILPDTYDSIWDWTHKDVILEGYEPHPSIKAEVAV